jgi:hypothetical protein
MQLMWSRSSHPVVRGDKAASNRGSARPLHVCAAKKRTSKPSVATGGAGALDKQKQMLEALSGFPKGSIDTEEAEALPGYRQGTADTEEHDAAVDVTVVRKGNRKQPRTVEELEGSLYGHPRLYDWAFGFRDYEEEVRPFTGRAPPQF